jgi:hypothetical protein
VRWTVGRRSSFEIRDSHHSIAWLDGSCSACCFSFVAEPGHTFPILNCPVAGRKNIEFRRQAESATHRTSFSPSSRRLPRHPNPCATKEQYRIFGIEIRELSDAVPDERKGFFDRVHHYRSRYDTKLPYY